MKISKEFFNFFKGYEISVVAKAVYDLNEREKDIIFSIWGENPTMKFNQNAQDIINRIKRNISKKSLKRAVNIYDNFELAEELSKLSLKERNTLLKEYFIDFLIPKEPLTKQEIDMNNRTIRKMKRKRTRNVVSIPVSSYKSFFKVFEDYNKDLVLKVFETLDEDEKELLIKKYGSDLQNIKVKKEVTDYDNYKIGQLIVVKMKRRLDSILSGDLIFVKIEDLYPNIDKKLLLIRSELLPKKDKERYYYYFGEDFSKEALLRSHEIEKLNYDHVREIMENKRIVNKEIRPLKEILYSLILDEESESDFEYRINKALATLSNEEMKILQKKYGTQLDKKINNGQYTIEEDYFVAHHIIPKLKRVLKQDLVNDELSIYDILNMTSEKVFLFINYYLTSEEILLLQKKYGKNYNEVLKVSHEDNIEIIRILSKIKNIIKASKVDNSISYEKLSLIRDILRFKKYDEIKSKYDERIALAALLVIYIDDIITDEELIALTGYSKEKISNLIMEDNNLRKLVSHRRLIKK